MGSKYTILPFLYRHLAPLPFRTVLDGFSGSGAVSYLLKAMDKQVTSNDFMRFSYCTAEAAVANSRVRVSVRDMTALMRPNPNADDFITRTFEGLYFTTAENQFLDNVTANIRAMTDTRKQALAYAAIARACLRKRPRGLFTYTGDRYLDGRPDLVLSLEDHFVKAVDVFNAAVFANGQQCRALNQDTFEIEPGYDLVYFDPPYVSALSDNDYIRRYHFVEGLTRYWEGVEILEHTMTKKFKRYPSPFDSRRTVIEAFERLFERFQGSIIAVSWSSNGIPSRDELAELLGQYKANVVVHEVDHRYSSGTHAHAVGANQNRVQEYLFIGSDT
ncbi:hypothetical protein GCM10008957_24940 [Deinococcus ruber]|uniref:site-specific DNA-methyltransferase (adenine-specific) n=2 Tax=Deinococcus ruber TaxID=1848197 RepID=A0A918F702_9DEIO|nr:hypothetical protein GCM10008957_24940 [Deinococcus ruber]